MHSSDCARRRVYERAQGAFCSIRRYVSNLGWRSVVAAVGRASQGHGDDAPPILGVVASKALQLRPPTAAVLHEEEQPMGKLLKLL